MDRVSRVYRYRPKLGEGDKEVTGQIPVRCWRPDSQREGTVGVVAGASSMSSPGMKGLVGEERGLIPAPEQEQDLYQHQVPLVLQPDQGGGALVTNEVHLEMEGMERAGPLEDTVSGGGVGVEAAVTVKAIRGLRRGPKYTIKGLFRLLVLILLLLVGCSAMHPLAKWQGVPKVGGRFRPDSAG